MNQPDVSIVVVNWNTRELVCNCLKSIFEQAGRINYEVIVVDNGSSDDSVQEVERRFPGVQVIANVTNRGYAAACNQGISASSGRYVLLLNSDILIVDGALEKTVGYADAHTDVALVGCQVRNDDNSILKTCFRFAGVVNLIFQAFGLSRVFKNNRFLGRERMRWWGRDTEEQVEVITGMFMLARRSAIDKVGLMDEDYFFYGEEMDWCYRFGKAGWKVMFWPGARVIHTGGGNQSSKKIPVKAFVQQNKSILIFFRKHRGLISYFSARFILVILYALRYCFWTLLFFTKPAEKKELYLSEKQKALAALAFCALSIEPEKPETKFLSVVWRKMVAAIEFVTALINSAALALLRKWPRRIVLYYHNIEKNQIPQFEKQMEYLARNYRVVKPSEIKSTSSNGDRVLVAITFDDAWSGVFENAAPILKRYDLPASISVPTGSLGKRPGWLANGLPFSEDSSVMSAEQVKELDKQGFEIFSHTVTHSKLTELDDGMLTEELTESRRELEEMLGHKIAVICYPHGDNNKRVRQYARQAGYQHGFTIEPDMVSDSVEDLELGRFAVSPDENLVKFRLRANGSYSVVKYLRAAKRFLIGKGR